MAEETGPQAVPTALERKALGRILAEEWEYVAKVGGAGTCASIIAKRWAEQLPGPPDRLCITEAGRAAYRRPVPEKLKRRPLKMLR